ncbi:MAG TPA: hypothetical protein VGW12_04815 [Pyrinomonadaceae bacterium]|nr:hypothetical protein [Pyrinomonadaceae bacterium]
MSVIGRLDDQVEAVLINPLKRPRAQGDDEARDESQSAATVEHAVQPSPDQLSHDSPEESPRERRDAQSTSLPVWML